jgi:hypothetical protein
MQQNPAQHRVEQVNVRQLMEKMQSKKDVFNFLTQECEAYLPKVDSVNMFFLKQITSAKKEVSSARADPVVYQAFGSQGRGGAADRWAHG